MSDDVQLGCLFSKCPKLFVDYSSAIVIILYCVVKIRQPSYFCQTVHEFKNSNKPTSF